MQIKLFGRLGHAKYCSPPELVVLRNYCSRLMGSKIGSLFFASGPVPMKLVAKSQSEWLSPGLM